MALESDPARDDAKIASPSTTANPQSAETPHKTEKDWWSDAKPFVEIAGLLLLAVYTLYTIKMYSANKKSAEAATKAANEAEQTLLLDQRAWVTITAVNGTKPEAGKIFKFSVHLINTGKSPARNVSVYPGEELLAREQSPTFSHTLKEVRLGILSPGSERTYDSGFSMPVGVNGLTKENITYLKTRTLSVHGKVTYDDIFGCHHWITYGTYLTDDWSGYSFYPQNNDTDNDFQPCHGE